MKDRRKQYFIYVLFAFISTGINLGTQFLVSFAVDKSGYGVFMISIKENITVKLVCAMAIATIVSFLFKFIVDKFFIFNDRDNKIRENIRQIIFYGSFAVITTLVFWFFELSFKFVLVFPYSEYIGGFIGLAVGYSLKFILDSRFVFNRVDHILR